MKVWTKLALFAAPTALLALSAATAHADATFDGDPVFRVDKGSRFVVESEVTMDAKGTVTVQGVLVSGESSTPFSLTKKFKTKTGKTKTRRIKLVVNPKKFGLRDLTEPLVLQAALQAQQGDDEPVVAEGGAIMPLPVAVVPGTANELDQGAYKPFVDAMNGAAGSPWVTKGRRATAAVFHYNSLSVDADKRTSLEALGAQIAKKVGKLDKKSKLFARVNLIGHSLGGVVIRQAMVPAGAGAKARPSLAGKVANVFFLGTPQSGTPIAYLAESAITAAQATGVDPSTLAGDLVAGVDNPSAARLAELLLNENFIGIVRLFIPTYPFADIPSPQGIARVGVETLPPAGDSARLSDLNGIAPDDAATYFAIYYSSVLGATGDVANVGAINLVGFLQSGSLADVELVDGPGDGVASVDSTLMESHPAWNAVLNPLNLGPGSQNPVEGQPSGAGNGYVADPNCIGFMIQTMLGLGRGR